MLPILLALARIPHDWQAIQPRQTFTSDNKAVTSTLTLPPGITPFPTSFANSTTTPLPGAYSLSLSATSLVPVSSLTAPLTISVNTSVPGAYSSSSSATLLPTATSSATPFAVSPIDVNDRITDFCYDVCPSFTFLYLGPEVHSDLKKRDGNDRAGFAAFRTGQYGTGDLFVRDIDFTNQGACQSLDGTEW